MAVRGLVPPIKAPGALVCCEAFRSQGGRRLCGGPGSRSLAACGFQGAAGVPSDSGHCQARLPSTLSMIAALPGSWASNWACLLFNS